MCRLSSIELSTMILAYTKGTLAFYTIFAGSTFLSNIQLHEAFGDIYKSYGSTLVLMGLISGSAVIPHRWGVKRHNRFVIACVFVADLIAFVVQIYMGRLINTYLAPDFPKDLQLDCLQNTPLVYSPLACSAYLDSDRVASMRLMWLFYFTDKANTNSFQILQRIQADQCCGFFAPFKCVPQNGTFPALHESTGIAPDFYERRLTCGPKAGYYVETDICVDYFDITTVPPTVGGCWYDLGVGYCLYKPVVPTSLGCASTVEDYMTSQIAPHALLLVAISFFNLIAMLLCCCMWWKRKRHDSFPEFQTGVALDVDFLAVKDQFEVKPQHGIMVKKGFVPAEKLSKRQLKMLAAAEQGKALALGEESKDNAEVEAAPAPPPAVNVPEVARPSSSSSARPSTGGSASSSEPSSSDMG